MKSLLFNEIINRFYYKKRYRIFLLFPLSFIAGMFEYFGLILIFQFVLFLTNPNTIYCKNIIDFFKNFFNISDVSLISFIIGCCVALIYILKNIYMLFFVRFNNNTLQDLSVEINLNLVKKILFQDFEKVYKIQKEKKFNMILKVYYIVWNYCAKIINLIINITISLLLVIYLFVKFTYSAIFASILVSILAFVSYKYLKSKSNRQNKYFSSSYDSLNSLILKVVNLIKEIKLNNKENYFLDKIEEKSKIYANLNNEKSFWEVSHIYFTEISIMVVFVLVLGIMFYTTNFDNQLLLSSISTICVIILRLTPNINKAQSALYIINSNRKLIEEFLELDDLFEKNIEDKIKNNKSNQTLPLKNKIELKNVFFSYKKESPGLQNINLEINKGDFIAVIGPNASYKTTLSLIIAGLIKPDKGEILIDETSLDETNKRSWQNNISYLAGDFDFLFFDDSKTLSSGQKQILGINELFKQNKDIIILDEITSALDVIEQEKINVLLNELKGEKTIIVIAHRLQILKHCTKIVFIDDGKIIDIGTFEDLAKNHEKFEKMLKLSNFSVK